MDIGAGLYMYDVVFTFAISSPDEFLFRIRSSRSEQQLS